MRVLVENHDFFHTPLACEYCDIVRYGKTRMVWLPYINVLPTLFYSWVGPTNEKIVLQRQTAHMQALW